MNLIRQETDYALRLISELGNVADSGSLSAKVLAQKTDVPYEFACKILQKLHDVDLVLSIMGPKGGFRLAKPTADITLLEVISAVQGPLTINNCALRQGCCDRQDVCPLTDKLNELQDYVEKYFQAITLENVLNQSKLKKETVNAT